MVLYFLLMFIELFYWTVIDLLCFVVIDVLSCSSIVLRIYWFFNIVFCWCLLIVVYIYICMMNYFWSLLIFLDLFLNCYWFSLLCIDSFRFLLIYLFSIEFYWLSLNLFCCSLIYSLFPYAFFDFIMFYRCSFIYFFLMFHCF